MRSFLFHPRVRPIRMEYTPLRLRTGLLWQRAPCKRILILPYRTLNSREQGLPIRWHEPKRLLQSCQFIVATRQGAPLDELLIAEKFTAEERRHIHVLMTPHLEISSSVIRTRIRAGLSVRYLVPRAVEEYIERRGLYREHDEEL